MNVSFTDYTTGSPSAWNWSYGDGTANGTSKNVTHVYANAGVYSVNLTTSLYGVNNTLSRSAYINVGQAPGAAFIANKTSGTNPTTILFNDTSSLTPTNWNWSFGDGGSNATTQNATRTFTSSGSYPVVLTAGNAYGSTSTSTTITVMSSNNASGYGQYYAAKTVTFHIQSAFGAPITGATVTMQGLSTSSGSWDWLGQLLGIRFNETPVNTQLMSALTDSNGDAQFFVFPTTIYQVNITKTGEISKSIQVTPTEERYTVPLDLNIFGSVGKDINGVTQFNVTTSQYNATAMKITVIGTDTMNHITGGIVRLNQTNITTNGTEIQLDSQPIPANNFTINFVVTSYAGKSYFVRINATQSDFGTVKRDFGVSFPKEKVNPMGLDNKMLMYGSILVLILCGAVFTTTTSYNGALLTCFVGWILYAVGWMEYAGTIMPIALTFATILSVAIIVIARRNAT
jgi:PKD repeat protein